jgi:hypothetical protein
MVHQLYQTWFCNRGVCTLCVIPKDCTAAGSRYMKSYSPMDNVTRQA